MPRCTEITALYHESYRIVLRKLPSKTLTRFSHLIRNTPRPLLPSRSTLIFCPPVNNANFSQNGHLPFQEGSCFGIGLNCSSRETMKRLITSECKMRKLNVTTAQPFSTAIFLARMNKNPIWNIFTTDYRWTGQIFFNFRRYSRALCGINRSLPRSFIQNTTACDILGSGPTILSKRVDFWQDFEWTFKNGMWRK